MSVRDLVRQLESSSPNSEGPATPTRMRRYLASPQSSASIPSPSPARFVHHPLLKRQSLPVSSPHVSPPPPPPSRVDPSSGGKFVQSETEGSARNMPRTVSGSSSHARGENGARMPDVGPSFGVSAGGSSFPAVHAGKNIGKRMNSAHTPERPSSSSYIPHGVKPIEETPLAMETSDDSRAPSSSSGSTQRASGLLGFSSQSVPDDTDAPRTTSNPSILRTSSASPSQQGIRKAANNIQSILRSSPPAYSLFQEGSLAKRPSYTLPRTRSSQASNNIPLDTFSRSNNDPDYSMTSRPLLPSATLISEPLNTPHVPIAAKTVFSRGSAPLSLPALDDYLSSFPAPKFSSFLSRNPKPSKGTPSDVALFPPMDLLATTGHTIEDLERNSTVQAWWRNEGSILNSLVNFLIGVMGSGAITTYYSLQGVYDGFQIFALLLSTFVPEAGKNIGDTWRKLFLGTIPNVLALNLGFALLESFILLIVLMALSGLLLYYFHVSTKRIALASTREGLQGKDTGAGWGIIFASFILTLIYLPLSTIAVHALLWSDDFWVVPNPYVNTTVSPFDIPPLGPPSEFRDPLDFCYTTTMNKNEINFAPAMVLLAGLTFIFLTVWFPIRLAMVIKGAVPRVDPYTELGKRRSKVELNHEYVRLLARDKNPFSFLYQDLRMGWGTYKSTYLFVKLSTLLIVAVLDPDNCVFRNANRNSMSVARQAVLLAAMSIFLVVHSILTPFLDPVNNASEWISRAGYVAFAVLGLTATLNLPVGVKYALNEPILYIVYVLNYGFTYYFLFIDFSWAHRLVKRLSRRIDFSIDIFSPHLDISSKSRHTRRRIWQESISVLLLASPECAIPKSQKMEFCEAQDSQWPPYLLDFQGTPAERHVENLKILREIGGLEYAKGVARETGRHWEHMKWVQEQIQRRLVGPDSFWRTPSRCGDRSGCFGNAWWIPFPPTLVMRYDTGELVVLNKLDELEEYVRQNEETAVQEKRSVRMALRALDGHVVRWPYTHTELIGARVPWCWGRRYKAQTSMRYESCVLAIRRRGSLSWQGIQLGSGFNIQLTYTRDVQVDGAVIGLDNDCDLTPQLARFLALNEQLISDSLPQIETVIGDYRRRARRNARAKCDALAYQFLGTIYCSPKEPHHLAKVLAVQEKDLRVRQTFLEHEDALTAANERMTFVNQSEASVWWYLYWDDLWRRNYDTISALNTHASDFNPHYPTSIAYRLLPRAALETFLTQRGLFFKNGGINDFIHAGVLNKLYFRLNQIVFRGSEKAIPYHLGDDTFEVDLEDLEFSSHARSSSLGTGGGTEYDDVSIRARPMYRWEAIFDDPLRHATDGPYRRWLPKLAVWFGLSPFWHSSRALTSGVSLDVKLEDGRYVLLENAVDELKDKVV